MATTLVEGMTFAWKIDGQRFTIKKPTPDYSQDIEWIEIGDSDPRRDRGWTRGRLEGALAEGCVTLVGAADIATSVDDSQTSIQTEDLGSAEATPTVDRPSSDAITPGRYKSFEQWWQSLSVGTGIDRVWAEAGWNAAIESWHAAHDSEGVQ